MNAPIPSARIPFSPRRVGAMILRYWYLLRHSWPRLLDLVYWPTVQLLMWGFLQVYLTSQEGFAYQAGAAFIGAVLLWDILFRGQIGFSVTFLEEMWSRNLGNLLMTPLRPAELVVALMAMSIVRVLIGFVPVSLMAIWFFGFNLWHLGLAVVAFFFNLILTSWSIGLVACGLVLKKGMGAEGLAWSLTFLLLPLCCVYYPAAVLPDWLRWIALSLPPTHVFEGLRSLVIGGRFDGASMMIALGLNVVYLTAAGVAFAALLRSARRSGSLMQSGE